MAARRVSKSSVDWAKFASLVPEQYTHEFRHLKVANDKFVGRVNALPAELKSIDFAKYKTTGVPAAMVDTFANQYKALEIPYPKDLANQKGRIDQEEVKAINASKAFIALLEESITVTENYVATAEKVPELGQMTREMYLDYFPEQVISNEGPALVEGEGYQRPDNPATAYQLIHPWQKDIKTWPDRIWDFLQWQFLFGKYANHWQRHNADLHPDKPELEEQRVEWLRKDNITNLGYAKIEAKQFPHWVTQEDLDERGWNKDEFRQQQLLAEKDKAEKK